MEFKKKQLKEIIDGNGDLIGTNAIPAFDANADTQAHGTTDQNAKIGQQPFRYDMLGRFGFTLMPFMEGVEENDGQAALVKDLAKLMYDKYMSTIEHYYRNPNKLKSDYRMHSEHDFESQPEHNKKTDFDLAKQIVKVVQKHFEGAFKEPEQIDEAKVVEDKMVNKKSEDEITKKSEEKDVRSTRLEKIAGLINKLEKKNIDKLINLLERK
jgi:hypothetical protein